MTIEKYIGREQVKERVFPEDEIKAALVEYVKDMATIYKLIIVESARLGLSPEDARHLWRSSVPSFAVYLIEREHIKRIKAEHAAAYN